MFWLYCSSELIGAKMYYIFYFLLRFWFDRGPDEEMFRVKSDCPSLEKNCQFLFSRENVCHKNYTLFSFKVKL